MVVVFLKKYGIPQFCAARATRPEQSKPFLGTLFISLRTKQLISGCFADNSFLINSFCFYLL